MRETKTITTPVGKHKVVIYTYLLGGEKRAFISVDPVEAQKVAIETLIVSIDGSDKDIMGTMDQMHGKDYDFIFNEIAKVIDDSSYSDKKKE